MSGPARGPGQAAGSRQGPWLSLSPGLPRLRSAGSGGRAVCMATAARVTGDSSLSCHGAMATACMASASKANTQPLIGFALITPAEFS